MDFQIIWLSYIMVNEILFNEWKMSSLMILDKAEMNVFLPVHSFSLTEKRTELVKQRENKTTHL